MRINIESMLVLDVTFVLSNNSQSSVLSGATFSCNNSFHPRWHRVNEFRQVVSTDLMIPHLDYGFHKFSDCLGMLVVDLPSNEMPTILNWV